MKLSELIQHAKEALAEVGDVPVLIAGDEEGNYFGHFLDFGVYYSQNLDSRDPDIVNDDYYNYGYYDDEDGERPDFDRCVVLWP